METEVFIDYVEVPPPEMWALLAYQTSIEESRNDHFAQCALEYEVATEIWMFLTRECDYSDAVAAGILGNIMNECGGNSLKLNPYWMVGANEYYGICMWSLRYAPSLARKDLDYQLLYLRETIPEAFELYGGLYKKGFTYEDFRNLSDPMQAAEAFMKVYERPGAKSLSTRQVNALRAYAYFVKSID